VYKPTLVLLLQFCGDADGDSISWCWQRPQHVPEVLTQLLSVVVLEVDTERHLVPSRSAISEAIVNADALADIAVCGFVAMSSTEATVAMVTSPSASAVICISD